MRIRCITVGALLCLFGAFSMQAMADEMFVFDGRPVVSRTLSRGVFRAPDFQTMRARVTSITELPISGSGYIVNWVGISVLEEGTMARHELLLVYVSEDQRFPVLQGDCLFRVHHEIAGGAVGRGVEANHDALIADDFQCGAELPEHVRDTAISWPSPRHDDLVSPSNWN